MKHILVIAITLLLSAFLSNGQSLADAEAAKSGLVSKYHSNCSKEDVYSSLFSAYLSYFSLSEDNGLSSDDKKAVKDGLIFLRPYLHEAAGYYSSKGIQSNALLYACAFVDISLMDICKDVKFTNDPDYSSLVYFAAAGSYNSRDYESAVAYFNEYLRIDEPLRRENVYACLGQSYQLLGNYHAALECLDNGLREYPSSNDMISLAINCAISSADVTALKKYVEKALEYKPDDEYLLFTLGQCHEEMHNYQEAALIFEKLNGIHANVTDVVKHLAISRFNVAAELFNKALEFEKEKNRDSMYYEEMAREEMAKSIPYLASIVSNYPKAKDYVAALALAYLHTGQEDQFKYMNRKYVELGGEDLAMANGIEVIQVK